MTVIGIAGCSALLVAGFGINDSIGDIAQQQYGNIYHYNATTSVTQESKSLADQIQDLKGVDALFEEQQFSGTVNIEGEDQTVTSHIIEDLDHFESFTTLKTMQGEPLSLTDQGVLISQKLADKLNLQIGDTFQITSDDKKSGNQGQRHL